MKIGDIAYKAYTIVITVPFIAGFMYFAVASCVTFVQEKNHDFGGNVEAIGVEYKGRRPYNPIMPLLTQDRNGYAEARFRGINRVFLSYDDLTSPSLDGKIIVIDSKGKESEFDDKAKYDGKILEDIGIFNGALRIVNAGRSLSDIVEREIQGAIARR